MRYRLKTTDIWGLSAILIPGLHCTSKSRGQEGHKPKILKAHSACQDPCDTHCWLLAQFDTSSTALQLKWAWIICLWRGCGALMCPQTMNETSGPAKMGQEMMLGPASFLKPRSPSGLVLRFYSITHHVVNSELPCALPGFGTRESQNLQFITTRITHTVVPPTEECNSETSSLKSSPFFVTTPLASHQAGVPFITLPQPPSSSLLLQLHQKRPERVIKAHQAVQQPPPTHPPSARAQGGKGGRFLQLQSLAGSFLFQDE